MCRYIVSLLLTLVRTLQQVLELVGSEIGFQVGEFGTNVIRRVAFGGLMVLMTINGFVSFRKGLCAGNIHDPFARMAFKLEYDLSIKRQTRQWLFVIPFGTRSSRSFWRKEDALIVPDEL